MKMTWIVLAVLALTIAAALLVARRSWRRLTADFLERLSRVGLPAAVPPPFAEKDLAGLPAPVVAYFRRALQPGQRHIKKATFEQQGSFLLKPTADGWRPFTASHTAGANPPAFVWDARIAAAPGMAVYVRDAFLEGDGYMKASLWGLVPLVNTEKTPEIAQGALYRYLAEAVWLPTALLPRAGVLWRERDAHSATAILRVGGTEVALDFFFGADDLIERVYAKDRARDVGGQGVPTPWQGRFSDYQERDGMLIPLAGEVEWILPEGPQPYWRGRTVALRYELW